MNKSVYLYELDSVRNSEKEIGYGQQRLYDEIVLKGNQVVLTFNQLADSKALLSALESKEYRESFLKLFELGMIRVSEYKGIRTPVQYILKNIREDSKSNDFIFSGIPIKRADKKTVDVFRTALINNDPQFLRISDTDLNKGELDYLIEYTKCILKISLDHDYLNKPKRKEAKKLSYYLHNVAYKVIGKEKYSKKIKELLCKIEDEFNGGGKVDSRSEWYKRLYSENEESEEVLIWAEAVIDICYNFTTEDSIYGISKRYYGESEEDCIREFEECLDQYLETKETLDHKFRADESGKWEEYSGEFPDWNAALRICENSIVKKQIQLDPKMKENGNEEGENYFIKDRVEEKYWNNLMIKGKWCNIGKAAASIVTIILGERLIEKVLDFIISVSKKVIKMGEISFVKLTQVITGELHKFIPQSFGKFMESSLYLFSSTILLSIIITAISKKQTALKWDLSEQFDRVFHSWKDVRDVKKRRWESFIQGKTDNDSRE